MTRGYDIQRLQTSQHAQLERLLRRVPRASPYPGPLSPVESLRQAENAYANLSLGLFDGSELVGYVLAFVDDAGGGMPSPQPSPTGRGSGMPSPPPSPASGRGSETLPPLPMGEGRGEGSDPLPGAAVVVADWVVAPRDRRASARLTLRFGQMLRERDDLRRLPLRCVCPDGLDAKLVARVRFFGRLGYRLSRQQPLETPAGGPVLHALVFEPHSRPGRHRPRTVREALRAVRTYPASDGMLEIGVVQTVSDWALLEPHWNRLLAATHGATVHQTYEYQRLWWMHLGTACDLWIVVVLKQGIPVAIAPLQISLLRWLGDDLRCLSFIGFAPESDRPRVLAANPAGEHALALAQYIASDAAPWDHLFLAEQRPDDAFVDGLARELRAAGHSARLTAGPGCAVVSLGSTWTEFLSGKSRAFRKSLKRKLAKLSAAGTFGFENLQPGESAQQLLERYLAVERASWKAGTTVGVAQSSAFVGFYREMIARFAACGAVEFHFLTLGGRTIAATFGLAWNRCFYSLHVAHDEQLADYSPGVVLTAMELQDAFERRGFDTFDFLSGTPANKAGWATDQLPSVDLLCTRGAVRGRLFHLIYFRLKPRVKKVLARWRLLEWTRRFQALAGRRTEPGDDG